MTKLRRVLIANRGEIALRIIRACFEEDIESVLVVSEADIDSLPAKLADRVVRIGPAPSSQSYLDVDRIVAAATATGCDAVHPGYGFLSEQPRLASALAEAGIVFVGPSIDTLERGGDKLRARELARSLGIPLASGSAAVTAEDSHETAGQVGYPILIKASAGGGGRGMGLVRDPGELDAALQRAQTEAREAFGDDRVYLERFVERARHVEVQILGDSHGNVIHLGERDCSVQRRYQKVVEEAPAVAVPAEVRARIHEAAVRLARSLEYLGAGTVEFLVDTETDEFFFLEMNTRVQVEHPVTEMVTGIDIVRLQLRIAAGEPLGIAQEDVRLEGHAIEYRVTAEDPDRGFLPAPGQIVDWVMPTSTSVRVDSHCFPGYRIPPFYDSLLAKIIVWGASRDAAIDRSRRVFDHVLVGGTPSSVPFHRRLLDSSDFREGRVTTRWLETEFLPSPGPAS